MPLGFGLGISYSPLLYRDRSEWATLYQEAVGDVPQPNAAAQENDQFLDEISGRIQVGLSAIDSRISDFDPEALIVLVADRDQYFDESNRPQIHIFSGEQIWGCDGTASSGRVPIACDQNCADLLIEELVLHGFDVAESRDEFRPIGAPARGVMPALHEFVARFAEGIRIIPIHINCHFEPSVSAGRLEAFGRALAECLKLTDRRVGIVASGGLSGNPGGYMAGWIDTTFDRWALKKLVQGRSSELSPAFQVSSQSLRGTTAEYKLWMTTAAAMEACNSRAELIDYMPLHHAASGIGMMCWGCSSCL